MSRQIFVNLAVQDLDRARSFFEQLGFDFEPRFTDAGCACMFISEGIHVMLLTQEKFSGFTRKPLADATRTTEVLTCLSADSREEVDRLADAALALGAEAAREPMDYGFMYGRSFHDLDGHVWELAWMDPQAMGGGQAGAAEVAP